MNAHVKEDDKGPDLLSRASARMAATLDMGQVARHLVAAVLADLADAVGIYVLEHLILGDDVSRPSGTQSVEARRIAVGVSGADLGDAFPVGEVVVFPPDSPYSRCVTTGTVQRFAELDADQRRRLRLAGDHEVMDRVTQLTDFVLVPLRSSSTILGFALFARTAASGAFAGASIATASELALRAAQFLDNARAYERERAVTRALQAGLIPRTLDAVPGVELAHRSVPAGETNLVGGDWCDVVPLDEGRVALVVGDAMGHGSTAAAAMVQLRASARTLMMVGMDPADTLSWLSRISPTLGPVQFATCVCAVYDTRTRIATLSRAGHPPPLLAAPDGSTEVTETPAGLPMGLGATEYKSVQLHLPVGATLALYTDGLIESRHHDLQVGITALQARMPDSSTGVQEACQNIVDQFMTRPNEDDLTLLLVRATDLKGALSG